MLNQPLIALLQKRLGPRYAELLLDLLCSDASNWDLARTLELKAFQVQYLRGMIPALYQRAHPLRLVEPLEYRETG